MRKSIVLLGILALVAACSRDKAPEAGSTTVTGAGTGEAKPVTVEEVRVAILDHNPTGPQALSTVIITSEGGVVTLRGTVPDEDTHANMINRVKRMPNVKSVHDELTVAPRAATPQPQMQPMPMDDSTKGGTTTPAATKTKTTDAIRTGMMKDKAAPTTVISGLMISDDGTVVIVSGTVPDDATHDAILKSAKKNAGNEHVQDNLHVSGK